MDTNQEDHTQDRLLDGGHIPGEEMREKGFRPKDFSEYIGQKNVVDNVKIMVQSARMRGQSMDHILLYGPPGLGKTSLAVILADTLGVQTHVISGPAVEKKGDLASILTGLGSRDILFIDEIHRLNIAVEEILYSAMEDFRLDIIIGQGGPGAKTLKIDIPPFTLIGATTRSGLLSGPLRDRFLAHFHFDFYQTDELATIIANNAVRVGLTLDDKARDAMARCARGTPRIANRILRRVRDFMTVQGEKVVRPEQVHKALELMGIDRKGLDRVDRKILSIIHDFYKGGPVGIEALCATLGEDRLTIEDVYEPFLLKEGFITRTPRGRSLSQKAVSHLKENQT